MLALSCIRELIQYLPTLDLLSLMTTTPQIRRNVKAIVGGALFVTSRNGGCSLRPLRITAEDIDPSTNPSCFSEISPYVLTFSVRACAITHSRTKPFYKTFPFLRTLTVIDNAPKDEENHFHQNLLEENSQLKDRIALSVPRASINLVQYLPSSLRTLHLHDEFNECVDHLPPSLTTLRFGVKFNRLVNSLPEHLEHLTLGRQFSRSLDHLPLSLKTLDISSCAFNLPIDNLPPSLHKLVVGRTPDLSDEGEYEDEDEDEEPTSVVDGTIWNGDWGYFSYFNRPINHLPSSLTELEVISVFNFPVNELPHSLSTLSLGSLFNQPVESLPTSLTTLKLGYMFNCPVDRLPLSLTTLKFGFMFNCAVDNLPPSLTTLNFGSRFNQPVNCLPPHLVSLSFGRNFNQPVDHLPSSLRSLALGVEFKHSMDNIPLSIVELFHIVGLKAPAFLQEKTTPPSNDFMSHWALSQNRVTAIACETTITTPIHFRYYVNNH